MTKIKGNKIMTILNSSCNLDFDYHLKPEDYK